MSDQPERGRARAPHEIGSPGPGEPSPPGEAPPAETPPAPDEKLSPEAPPPRPGPPYRALALGLAGALVLLVALVGTAPFWAKLLPWGAAPPGGDAAILERIERLEAAQQDSLPQLDRRVAALETRPAPAMPDLGDVRQRIAALAAATAELAARVEGIDKAVRARPAPDIADKVEALERALRDQAAASTALVARVEALDSAVRSGVANDATDRALVLALLQIRGAIQAGRPFIAEHAALTALAQARPEIAAAAAPLAEVAKTGVASRGALTGRLRELAGTIAGAATPPSGPDPELGWAERALARLRGLVTIRRIDAAGRTEAEAVVSRAERALAGGDLEGAVAVLDKLEGAPAGAASPWLHMARQRIAVDAALQRIEALLTARLGGAAPEPEPEPGSPG